MHEGKPEECRNVGFNFSIVGIFRFSKYRVGVGFSFLNIAISMSVSVNRLTSTLNKKYDQEVHEDCSIHY